MGDGIRISTEATVYLDADKILDMIDPEDVGLFLSKLAQKLDGQFVERAAAASEFAGGLSEQGCRFLAEAVTSHYMRQARR